MPFWEARQPHSFIGWGKSTQLGYSLGLAMGAKLAAPDKEVIHLMGDAAFGMVGMDIETAVRAQIPILTMILEQLDHGHLPRHRFPEATEALSAQEAVGQLRRGGPGPGAHSERIDKTQDIVPAIRRATGSDARRATGGPGDHDQGRRGHVDVQIRLNQRVIEIRSSRRERVMSHVSSPDALPCLRTGGEDHAWSRGSDPSPGEGRGQIYHRVFQAGDWRRSGSRCGHRQHSGVFASRHERLGVEIADGYARATGQVGVAMTGTGPGATNTLTGIADCYADNVPVLLLMGQHPLRNLGKEYQQEVSASIFDGLVKWRGTFTRVDDIPGLIRRAFTALRSGSPGPVVLEMPQDVLKAEGGRCGAAV